MRKKRVVTIEELRIKFPLGATVYYKDSPIGTVCGYQRWINNSWDNEPEVLYVNWKIKREYPSKIGLFTVRSPHFRTKVFELAVSTKHHSGIGAESTRVIFVHFDPKEHYEHEKVWRDVTNQRWAIWENDLHKIVRQ
jgi:hypothetical protein